MRYASKIGRNRSAAFSFGTSSSGTSAGAGSYAARCGADGHPLILLREPVAEAAIDVRLRRVENGRDLATRHRVVELELHHRSQRAAPTMGAGHTYGRDTGDRDRVATRHGHVHAVGRGRTHEGRTIERTDDPIERREPALERHERRVGEAPERGRLDAVPLVELVLGHGARRDRVASHAEVLDRTAPRRRHEIAPAPPPDQSGPISSVWCRSCSASGVAEVHTRTGLGEVVLIRDWPLRIRGCPSPAPPRPTPRSGPG